VETVKQALHDNALEPAALEIEITESIMAEDKQVTMATLSTLRNMGVRVAIDDFGTGYSSFSYLREISFDTLKIDKAFIDDVPGTHASTAIMAGIIQIGTLLGKNVVAEGVATEKQAKALLKHGCVLAQGYFFSRPLSVSDFEVFVSQRATRKLA